MKGLLDLVSTVVVTVAAVAMLAVYLQDRRGTVDRARFEEGWEQWGGAFTFGVDEATVNLDVFVDFTCPHCGRLEPVLDSVLTAFPRSVRVRIHHFPLQMEGTSFESAAAAECARAQGRGKEMYDELFGRQRLIGVESWERFAEAASVADLEAFADCMQQPPEAFERILSGRALGEEVGVRGTPTIWLNGRLFDSGRSVAAIHAKAVEMDLLEAN